MADSDKKTAEQKAAEALQDSYIEKKAQSVRENKYLLERVQNDKKFSEIYTDFNKTFNKANSSSILGQDLNYYANTFNNIDVDYLKDINKELKLFTDDDIVKISQQHAASKNYLDTLSKKQGVITSLGDVSEDNLKNIEKVYSNIAGKNNLDDVTKSFNRYKELKTKLNEAVQNGADEAKIANIRKGIAHHAEKIAGKNNVETFNKLYDVLGSEGTERVVSNAVEHASNASALEKGVKDFLNDQVTKNLDFRKDRILTNASKANDIAEDALKGRVLGDVLTDIGAVSKMSIEHNTEKAFKRVAKTAGKYILGAAAVYGLVQMLHDDKGMDNSQLYNNTPII